MLVIYILFPRHYIDNCFNNIVKDYSPYLLEQDSVQYGAYTLANMVVMNERCFIIPLPATLTVAVGVINESHVRPDDILHHAPCLSLVLRLHKKMNAIGR